MEFPISVVSTIILPKGNLERTITLHSGLTVILGPNGSGKTQLMRGLKEPLKACAAGKKVSFASAGRIGPLEHFRSDHDGYRHSHGMQYDQVSFGGKDTQSRRHLIETLQGSFQSLAARPDILLKIRERLNKLFHRGIELRWESGNLQAFFSDKSGEQYSSGREASGLLHLVGILAAAYDDEVGALLLDEPEVSLHPQLQSFIFQELKSVAGLPSEGTNRKLIIICSHSTEFISVNKPEDLLNLVFTSSLSDPPVQIPPDAGELRSRRIAALIGRMGQEHKLSLFASSPLLIEGPSDSILASSVARRLNLELEAGGSQLLPVIGKGQFSTVSKLLRMMGKRPVILADADAITDNLELAHFVLNCDSANLSATKFGAETANQLATQVYSAFCQLIDDSWETLAPIATKHPYWLERDEKQDKTLHYAKRRASFATIFGCDDAALSSLESGQNWIAIRNRFAALLGLLEEQGCFILRKGTIECYFSFGRTAEATSKLEAAAIEGFAIDGADPAKLREVYSDVVRCLEFASAAEEIVEAEALQQVLLAICAPAMATVRQGTHSEGLNRLARSILPELSTLFDLEAIEGQLRVTLLSKILTVEGFPIVLSASDDVVTKVAQALKLQ